MRYFYFLLATSFCQMGCSQIADIVFVNGKIYTVDEEQTIAQSIAVKDGKIIYVGSDDQIDNYISADTKIEDLEGRLMLPGLHDVHMHPLEAGSPIGGSCLLDSHIEDPYALADILYDCNLQPNSNGWITAFGHSIFALIDSDQAPREILDEVYPNTPVAVMEETSHSFWVNSAALEELGITAQTPDPEGGHIFKDEYTGEPTGLLLDNAGDVVIQEALASNQTIDDLNYDGLVEYSLPLLSKLGITSFCEARTYWKRNYHHIWKDIQDNGELTARVTLSPWIYPEDSDESQLEMIKSLFDESDDFLKTNHIKVYSDGIVINATSAMEEPYVYNLGLPFDRGLNYLAVNRLAGLITVLEREGYHFHIHAIGDRGIRESLDAIEAARNTNGDLGMRHRITHCEIMKEADYPRFAQLNVTADAQVAGDFTHPEHWHENDFLIGSHRTQNIIPIRSLYENGARIVLSSDWDVSSSNPFVGMQNALTRAPQNMPNIHEVIKAYTINAAYVMNQEDKVGSIEVGKYADLVVLDRDITTITTETIKNTVVLGTWLAGEEIYRSEDFPSDVIDINTATDILIYPNPIVYELRLDTDEKIDSLLLYDTHGILAKQLIIDQNNVDFSGIETGAYLLKVVFSDGKRLTKKLFKL